MSIIFDERVRERLDEIEREEGITVDVQVAQAVSVWSHLRGVEERRIASLAIMRIVVGRSRS